MSIRDMSFSFSARSPELRPFPHIRLFGVYCHRKATRSFPEHRNDGLELCYAIRGEIRKAVDGREITIKPGEASLTRPWQIHGGIHGIRDRGIFACIMIRPRKFNRNGELNLGEWSAVSTQAQVELGSILAGPRPVNIGQVKWLEELVCELHFELTQKPFGFVSRANGIATEILLKTARCLMNDGASRGYLPPAVRRTIETVENNPAETWTLSGLSRMAGLKPTAFSNWVREATGFAPMNYVIHLRIDMAKKLLIDTPRSITDIAMLSGFSSSQHFNNTFKKHCGMPPGLFRNNPVSFLKRSSSNHADKRKNRESQTDTQVTANRG